MAFLLVYIFADYVFLFYFNIFFFIYYKSFYI